MRPHKIQAVTSAVWIMSGRYGKHAVNACLRATILVICVRNDASDCMNNRLYSSDCAENCSHLSHGVQVIVGPFSHDGHHTRTPSSRITHPQSSIALIQSPFQDMRDTVHILSAENSYARNEYRTQPQPSRDQNTQDKCALWQKWAVQRTRAGYTQRSDS